MFDLHNKVAIVTGGARGIGEAICHGLSAQGTFVCILDIDTEASHTVHAAIKAKGGKSDIYPCDTSDLRAMEITFARIHAERGSIDILVNNAAIAHIGTVETTTEKDMDHLYRVNVKGVYNGMRAAIPYMKAHRHGSVINMASIVSTVGLPNRFAYTMTKGAVLAMTRSVATDYLHVPIRCNCILPARVHTPFVDGYLDTYYPDRREEMFKTLSQAQPVGRMCTPEEVATLAVYLSSEAASFITGAALPIDGGVLSLRP